MKTEKKKKKKLLQDLETNTSAYPFSVRGPRCSTNSEGGYILAVT